MFIMNLVKSTFAIAILLLSVFTSLASNKDEVSPTIDPNLLVVQTKQGKVQGTTEQKVCVWRGIPYAKAPVGELRFKSPQPADSWPEVKNATQFGAASLQPQSSFTGNMPKSEDCLSLNIWSPAADGKKRPVMFWIHGGGFIVGAGSSDLYNGANLAQNGDVVVVSFNYRLGVLGFLFFEGDAATKAGLENNLGIKDQIAALKWVKENIAAFGGDPNQVTIFGESAGGTSVETLLACPAARGLFKGAIAESGPTTILWTKNIGHLLTQKFLSFLNINEGNLSLLKSLPADTLKAAEYKLAEFMMKETTTRVFCPTIDGQLLTTNIDACLNPTQSGHVALMIGTNKDEATMFTRKGLEMVPTKSKELEKDFLYVIKEDEKLRITSAYKQYPRKRGVLDLVTDGVFRIPAIRMAECQSKHSTVYMYRFEFTSFLLNLTGKRSFHGLELPFVFGNTENKVSKLLKVLANKKTRLRLSSEMQLAWINFARYGNPNGEHGNTWKNYDVKDRSTMIFNRKTKLVNDPGSTQRKAWDGVDYY